MQIPGVPLQHKMKYNNCCAYDFKELGKEVYLDKSFPAPFCDSGSNPSGLKKKKKNQVSIKCLRKLKTFICLYLTLK